MVSIEEARKLIKKIAPEYEKMALKLTEDIEKELKEIKSVKWENIEEASDIALRKDQNIKSWATMNIRLWNQCYRLDELLKVIGKVPEYPSKMREDIIKIRDGVLSSAMEGMRLVNGIKIGVIDKIISELTKRGIKIEEPPKKQMKIIPTPQEVKEGKLKEIEKEIGLSAVAIIPLLIKCVVVAATAILATVSVHKLVTAWITSSQARIKEAEIMLEAHRDRASLVDKMVKEYKVNPQEAVELAEKITAITLPLLKEEDKLKKVLLIGGIVIGGLILLPYLLPYLFPPKPKVQIADNIWDTEDYYIEEME